MWLRVVGNSWLSEEKRPADLNVDFIYLFRSKSIPPMSDQDYSLTAVFLMSCSEGLWMLCGFSRNLILWIIEVIVLNWNLFCRHFFLVNASAWDACVLDNVPFYNLYHGMCFTATKIQDLGCKLDSHEADCIGKKNSPLISPQHARIPNLQTAVGKTKVKLLCGVIREAISHSGATYADINAVGELTSGGCCWLLHWDTTGQLKRVKYLEWRNKLLHKLTIVSMEVDKRMLWQWWKKYCHIQHQPCLLITLGTEQRHRNLCTARKTSKPEIPGHG